MQCIVILVQTKYSILLILTLYQILEKWSFAFFLKQMIVYMFALQSCRQQQQNA